MDVQPIPLDMDPFQAFLNIVMSTLSGGLIGLSRGVKCCPPGGNIPVATAVPVMKGGMKGGNMANELTNFNLQIGDMGWRPFDIYSNNVDLCERIFNVSNIMIYKMMIKMEKL